MACAGMPYIAVAYITVSDRIMAYMGPNNIVMAYVVMTYIVLACTVIACIVMAQVAMAYLACL